MRVGDRISAELFSLHRIALRWVGGRARRGGILAPEYSEAVLHKRRQPQAN